MAKIRVYELAKQLSVSSRDLIDVLKELGAPDIKSHQSGIDEAFATKAWSILVKRSTEPAAQDEKKSSKPDKNKETAVPEKRSEKSVSAGEPSLSAAAQSAKVSASEKTTAKPATLAVPSIKSVKEERPKASIAQEEPQQDQSFAAAKVEKNQAVSVTEKQQNVKTAQSQKSPEVHKNLAAAPAHPSIKEQKQTFAPTHPAPSKQQSSPNIPKPTAKPPQSASTKDFKPHSTGQGHPAPAHVIHHRGTHAAQVQAKSHGFHSRSAHPHSRPSAPVAAPKETGPAPLEVVLPITIGELAAILTVKPTDILKKLLEKGRMLAINHSLDKDSVYLILDLLEIPHERISFKEDITSEEEEADDVRFMTARPPVVTILGHVDHGKTSLLDAIRNTNVIAGEAGGITQKIGAYMVEHNSKKIAFIDTPGHEAFTAMRARGAQVTDVAVLVVAADDGVMPQTIEAINHAKAAGVPIIVALNKIDKASANPDRVKQQLADHNLLTEDWGGDIVCVPVSAKAKTGIEDLLEMILLVAELNDFKADARRMAQGVIIESKLDKGLGPVATVLVKKGTLRVGDSVIAGLASGKIRILMNDKGERVKKATPSVPVEIVGLTELPNAGDVLRVVKDEKLARQISTDRHTRDRERNLISGPKTTLQEIFKNMEEGEKKDLFVIIKADGNGSVEAIKHSLGKLPDDEVKVHVVHGGVGTITESDVLLARASQAIIIGFNIKDEPKIKKLAEQERIDIRYYNVIYHMIEDIQNAMKGLLEPEYELVLSGKAEVRQTFKISKIGVIIGCYVISGKIIRNSDIKIYRGKNLLHEGKLESLKRFKDDVKEVLEGFECGMSIEKFNDLEVGDIIEAYQLKEKER